MKRKGYIKELLWEYEEVLPIVLVPCVNSLAYYLGLYSSENSDATIFSYAIYAFYALFFLFSLWKHRNVYSEHLLVALPILFLGISIFYGFARGSMNLENTRIIMKFLGFGVTAYHFGVVLSIKQTEWEWITKIERIFLISFPLAVIYSIKYIFVLYEGYNKGNLGQLNYMSIANIFLPFLLALTLRYIFSSSDQAKRNLLRMFLIGFVYLVILITSLKGAIFGLISFSIFTLFLLFIRKGAFSSMIKATGIMVFFLVSLVVLSYYYTPKAFTRLTRVSEFVSNVSMALETDSHSDLLLDENKNTVSSEQKETDKTINPAENTQKPTLKRSQLIKLSTDELVEYVYQSPDRIRIAKMRVLGRSAIYKLVLREVSISPLLGMGPLGFQNKYGIYPHNFLLEIVVDWGIPIGILATLFVLYLSIKLLFLSLKIDRICLILCFFSGFSVAMLASGSIWVMPMLMYLIGWGLMSILSSRSATPLKEFSE